MTSDTATITGISEVPLAITAQPADSYAKLGERYSVTVESVGDGLKYQWYFMNANSDVWHKSRVKSATYSDVMIKARAGRKVYCVITDALGNSVTSVEANLIKS